MAGLVLSATGCAAAPHEAPRASSPKASAPPRCAADPRPPSLTEAERRKLEALALISESTGVVVWESGEIVLSHGDVSRPVELMSVTKSVVGLLVGQVVAAGKLRLEQPAADFIPAWRGTPKAAITVRHLLAQTSGLHDEWVTEAIYKQKDFVAFAVESALDDRPGDRFRYSNRGANLLPFLVREATGAPIEDWARDKLFAPLGISRFTWARDLAGNSQGMAGLSLSVGDLATLGSLFVTQGRSCDREVVPETWLKQTVEFNPRSPRGYGLAWWLDPERQTVGLPSDLFDEWAESGMPPEFLAKLRPLEGQWYPGKTEFFAAVQRTLLGRDAPVDDANLAEWYKLTWQSGRPDGRAGFQGLRAIRADGYGGQCLVVLPTRGVVVARLREIKDEASAKEALEFAAMVSRILVPAQG